MKSVLENAFTFVHLLKNVHTTLKGYSMNRSKNDLTKNIIHLSISELRKNPVD